MARWKIDDFRNPSKEVLFNLCLENLYDCDFENVNDDEIDREKFRDFLVKYDLQQHTDWLIEYQVAWNHLQSGLEVAREKRESHINISRPYALKVAKILKMFLTEDSREYKGLEISAKLKREKIEIAGKDLFDQLKITFIKEFERLGLNETELSIEEAKEEIENNWDDEWFELRQYEADVIHTDPWALENYRLNHFRPREVSLEIVNKAISEIEIIQKKNKRGVGAKIKNLGIGELAKRLSYLHRIQEFLNDKENISIKNYALSNKTCRFIYDYFEYWNILPDSVKHKKDNIENRANYIKSLITNNENFFKKAFPYNLIQYYMIVYDEKLELKIDLFKEVKDGLITPNQYYERT